MKSQIYGKNFGRGSKMATKRLGRGLDGIIQNKTGVTVKTETRESAVKGIAVMVDINKIERNKEQPRKNFGQEALEELAQSIKQHGVLEPLLVQDCKDYYEIIAGERRWRAAKIAGIKEVPVIIKNMTKQEIVEISLIENIQREDLDPIEEAMAYKKLKSEFKLTDDQVAEKVSKSRTAITNSMRLLKLGEELQQLVISGELSTGHARALLALPQQDKQQQLAKKIIAENLSVRDTEALVKQWKEEKEKPQKKNSTSEKTELKKYQIQYDSYAEKLSRELGVKVSVSLKEKNNGKLEIEFYSADDFEKIYDKLK